MYHEWLILTNINMQNSMSYIHHGWPFIRNIWVKWFRSDLKDSSPKNFNSVINYMSFQTCKTFYFLECKLRYCWWNPRAFWPYKELLYKISGFVFSGHKKSSQCFITLRLNNWGLIYKMLRRNHPKFDLTIISQICVRVIHKMNVRTENTRTRLFQMWNVWIANDLLLLNGFSSLPCKWLLINVINM